MLNKKIEDALNKQINAELYSSYLYLSMQAYFESENLGGFANWMGVQMQEELSHALKIFNFVNERSGRVLLKAIDQPQTEWKSPLDVFDETLKHEQKVTGMINKLTDLAISEKDHATASFLKWFVDEQVEEEASANKILQQLVMIKGSTGGLFMLDKELGKRIFKSPAKED
jgi:ferritin